MSTDYYQTVPRRKDKTDVIKAHPLLKQFVLDTRQLSKSALQKMLLTYPSVVFKPTIGGGKLIGFMTHKQDTVSVQLDTQHHTFSDYGALYTFIKGLNKKKRFILQRGVDLLTLDDRPVDVRVNMQKVTDDWEMSGIVARIAPPNPRENNDQSDGHGVLLREVFSCIGINDIKYEEIRALLVTVGYMSARLLNEVYTGLRELGFDIGIDKQLRLHILEINTKPQFGIFHQVSDPIMAERIEANHKKILESVSGIKRTL